MYSIKKKITRSLYVRTAMLFHAIFLEHVLPKPSFYKFLEKRGDVTVSIRAAFHGLGSLDGIRAHLTWRESQGCAPTDLKKKETGSSFYCLESEAKES